MFLSLAPRLFLRAKTMSKVNLVDCNNIVRIRFEKDGYALRNLFEWAFRDPEPHIFIFDGRNAKKARRDIFPGYKVGRPPAPDNFYKQLDIFQELLMHTNKVQMKVDNYEADDVIATLVNGKPDGEFLIHSNDGDFMRLCGERVQVTTPTIKDVPPNEIRLYKTLKGDGSDKIPGVRLFGPKSWTDLTPDGKAKWTRLLESWAKIDPKHAEDFSPYFDPAGLNLTSKQHDWVMENWALVRSFWLVVDFLEVPNEAIVSSIKVGKPNYALADSLLKELFL